MPEYFLQLLSGDAVALPDQMGCKIPASTFPRSLSQVEASVKELKGHIREDLLHTPSPPNTVGVIRMFGEASSALGFM